MSMTLRRNANPDQAADAQPPEAEALMRRALGLSPSGGQRPRARAGDGPVVEHRGDRHAASSVNRVAAAEAALAEERHAREQLARQLREAEAALREAQTKRGHAELARDELQAALAAERSGREAAEERIRELSEAIQSPPRDEQTMRAISHRAVPSSDPTTPAKRRGRPPGSVSKTRRVAEKNPEPGVDDDGAVQWWVPGWQDRI